MFRLQRTGLELDAFEAIGVDHAPGLSDDLLFAERFSPAVGRVGCIGMLRIFEEQVGAEGYLVTNGAAEQVHQWQVHGTRLQVQKRYFERRISIADRLAGV